MTSSLRPRPSPQQNGIHYEAHNTKAHVPSPRPPPEGLSSSPPLHSTRFFRFPRRKPSKQIRPTGCRRARARARPPPAMVGVALAPAVSRVPCRPGASFHASRPSSSARLPARPRARAPPERLVVVARYSSSYEVEGEEEEEDEEGLGGGGGWGRRDRGPDPDYDPALDIERIEYVSPLACLIFYIYIYNMYPSLQIYTINCCRGRLRVFTLRGASLC